jgi:hypothetical protein
MELRLAATAAIYDKILRVRMGSLAGITTGMVCAVRGVKCPVSPTAAVRKQQPQQQQKSVVQLE